MIGRLTAALAAGVLACAAAPAWAATCSPNLSGQSLQIDGQVTLSEDYTDVSDPMMIVEDTISGCGIVVWTALDPKTFEESELCPVGAHFRGKLTVRGYDAKSGTYEAEGEIGAYSCD